MLVGVHVCLHILHSDIIISDKISYFIKLSSMVFFKQKYFNQGPKIASSSSLILNSPCLKFPFSVKSQALFSEIPLKLQIFPNDKRRKLCIIYLFRCSIILSKFLVGRYMGIGAIYDFHPLKSYIPMFYISMPCSCFWQLLPVWLLGKHSSPREWSGTGIDYPEKWS